ncbi:hypothetical protein GCM10018779_59540 [Streptomyces griseocarneus]|nr:hypothetical protein GCM10018779_59540 [Streptomyces griseocarneus]
MSFNVGPDPDHVELNAGYVNPETRCPLCDRRLVDRGSKHDRRCLASGLSLVLLYNNAGHVLDCALHYARRLQPARLRAARVRRSLAGCLQCGAALRLDCVSAGRRRQTDLAFVLHEEGCGLSLVPVSGVIGLAEVHGQVPSDLAAALALSELSHIDRRAVIQAAERTAAYVPDEKKRCPLCAGRLVTPGGDADHLRSCAAQSVPGAASMLTAGQVLSATQEVR